MAAKVVNPKAWSLYAWAAGYGTWSYPQVPRPLGTNLGGVNYFSPELPFLNIVKQGGQAATAGVLNGWITNKSGTFYTGESAYLQLDADGYVTSLVASPTPPGGQQFTGAQCFLVNGLNTAPNAPSPYPADTYRFQWQGKGTIQFGSDVTALANASAGCTISGTSVTSTNAWGTVNSVTLQGAGTGGILVPSAAGIPLTLTAIPDSTNYPKAFTCVQSTYTALFDAGGINSIFHPAFLASLTTGQSFQCLRFMDWAEEGGGGGYQAINYSGGTLAQGATSGTMTSAWINATQTRTQYFSNGDQRQTLFTLGSTTADWSADPNGGVSSAVGTTVQGATVDNGYVNFNDVWSARSLPSNCFWNNSRRGVPLEIMIALANKIGAAGWFVMPAVASSSYINSFVGLVINGTGIMSGYSPLAGAYYQENSNEVWNPQVPAIYRLAVIMGSKQFGGSGPGYLEYNQCWNGYQCAQIANAMQSIAGSKFSRCYPVVGCWAANEGGSAPYSLLTPLWTAGAAVKIAPIKVVAIAPYFGNSYAAADMTTMMGVATPIDDFFACLNGQVGTAANGSKNYSGSVPSGGWMAATESGISSYVTYLAGLSGTMETLSLVGYEGGQSFIPSTTVAGWQAMVESAERDARMGAFYTTLLTYWRTNVGATSANIFNVFNDAYQPGVNGAWGNLESVLQPLTGVNTPPRYLALQNYMAGL